MALESMDTQMNVIPEKVPVEKASDSVVCGICWMPYSKNVAYPITLRCGHTFCKPCLTMVYRTRGSIHCGSCRSKVYASHKILKKNLQLVEVLGKHGYLREDPPEEPEPAPAPNQNRRVREHIFLEREVAPATLLQYFQDFNRYILRDGPSVGGVRTAPNQQNDAIQIQPGDEQQAQVDNQAPQNTDNNPDPVNNDDQQDQLNRRDFLRITGPFTDDYQILNQLLGPGRNDYLPPLAGVQPRANTPNPIANDENNHPPATINDNVQASIADAAPVENVANPPVQEPAPQPVQLPPASPEVMAQIEGILANIREMGEPIQDALDELLAIAASFEGDVRHFRHRLQNAVIRLSSDIQNHSVHREVGRIYNRQRLIRHPEEAARRDAMRQAAMRQMESREALNMNDAPLSYAAEEIQLQQILFESLQRQQDRDENNEQGAGPNQNGAHNDLMNAFEEAIRRIGDRNDRDDDMMTALEIGTDESEADEQSLSDEAMEFNEEFMDEDDDSDVESMGDPDDD